MSNLILREEVKNCFRRSNHRRREYSATNWTFGWYPFMPFLRCANWVGGTTSSVYPQSKQTNVFWQTYTGDRLSLSIPGKAIVNSPEKFCWSSDEQALQAITPSIHAGNVGVPGERFDFFHVW